MTVDTYRFYLLFIDRRHNAITRAYYQIHIAGCDNHQYHGIPSLDIQNINAYVQLFLSKKTYYGRQD